MSWDAYSSNSWDAQPANNLDYLSTAGLREPEYELEFSQKRTSALTFDSDFAAPPIPQRDPYYSNTQLVDIAATPTNTTHTNAGPPGRSSSTPSFQATGVVTGLDASQWANKETATNCKLCEAPFSTLAKRKHNCRVCGEVFCGNCTSDKLNISQQGMQRVCFLCFSAHSTLGSDEQRVVAEICEELGEYPQMQTMIFRKKDSGPSSRHHAIVVVSRYKIICLRRSSPKTGIKLLNLLDLGRISMPRAGTLLLEFGKITGNPLVEQYDTAKAPELLLTIRTQHGLICLGMPDHCQLIADAPPEAMLRMNELPPVGVAGGFIDAYRAWCNFYNVEPSQEMIQFVTDSVERCPFVLDLTHCPGVEPGSNISFDFQPVFQALRYNTYFLALDLRGVTAKGAMELLVPCLKANRVLTRLRLSNLITSHLRLVGSALAENSANHLRDIDLSGTKISDKAIRSIALSIVAKEFGLRSLNLKNCELTARGIGSLLREGFLPSPEVTCALQELNLSENKFDEEGSVLLQVWLSKMGKRSALKNLNISKCNALLGFIVPALEHLPNLESLNLSYNILDMDSLQVLCNILQSLHTLKAIDISHCGLSSSGVSSIISTIVKNPNLRECKAYFGGNLVDETNFLPITTAITPSRSLHTLDLSQWKLGEKGILELFITLTTNAQTLNTLIFSDFFNQISGMISGARVGHALADLILQVQTIQCLDISLSKTSLFSSTGPAHVILPFLQRMQRNETLLSLNLRGNRLGDKIATALADVLRCNTTLIYLNADDNRITLNGFQALEYALQRNRVLQKFEFPTGDVGRIIKAGNMPLEKQTHLFNVLSNIQLAVTFNLHTNGCHPLVRDDSYEEPAAEALKTYSEQTDYAPPPPQPQQTTWGGYVVSDPQVPSSYATTSTFSTQASPHSSFQSTDYTVSNYSRPTPDWEVNQSTPDWEANPATSYSQSTDWNAQTNSYAQPTSYSQSNDWETQTTSYAQPQSNDRTSDLFSALASALGEDQSHHY